MVGKTRRGRKGEKVCLWHVWLMNTNLPVIVFAVYARWRHSQVLINLRPVAAKKTTAGIWDGFFCLSKQIGYL